MTIRAVFFDFGGVILRTEYQSPRQQLAERFNMEYAEIDKIVFGSASARRAAMGEIKETQHWKDVLKRLNLPVSELQSFTDTFFGGDILDRDLVAMIRSLRGQFHTGLISNAWSGLRKYITKEKIIDVFDTIIISAEVGVIKPNAKIYQIALEQAQVRGNEAVFIDDVEENIEGCVKVGMQGILFRDPQATLYQLRQVLKIQ